ncbi:heavy metal transport/detoxification superfamily protein [Artemisia annua]|uniref:Heavy metal transport/detoxification superfamily protein n=1 Tax=Artemisia annua TaxID=35608 RepID=A0A2U1LM94_ARTAN|nr:heavy metal transport/detoxification superfamily protein [Artemisia annua]
MERRIQSSQARDTHPSSLQEESSEILKRLLRYNKERPRNTKFLSIVVHQSFLIDLLLQVFVAEFNISLICDRCEELVVQTISKIKGVEKFMTNTTRHQVVVMGKIDPIKVLKKLKKTGKIVEMTLSYEQETPDDVEQGDIEPDEFWQPVPDPLTYDCLGESTLYTIFSDENPNACSIM